MAFNYDLDFDNINFREKPELYRVGRGEQGVLLVEPYKSEILPYWRFKTPDMARKFLQMGYTRARRYANYKGGRKYDENGEVKERDIDPVKAESASIFEKKWILVREDEDYLKLKKEHQKKYG